MKWIRGFACCLILAMLAVAMPAQADAQQRDIRVHSHNDYHQEEPFWRAFRSGCASIEVDLVLQDDILYVAHEAESIQAGITLTKCYLEPLSEVLRDDQDIGKLILLIDLKTPAEVTLQAVIDEIGRFPDLVDAGRQQSIQFVISGNRPEPEAYTNYPDHIFFDYQSLDSPPSSALPKIALVSLSYARFAREGKRESISYRSQRRIQTAVKFAHGLDKPIRLWGTPDNVESWEILYELGLDYVGTDKPEESAAHFTGRLER